MSLNTENPIENSQEALFEGILRQISVKAFEALITCGVRDINGFLSLTAGLLNAAGVKPSIAAELIDLQRQVTAQNNPEPDTEVDNRIDIVTDSDELQSDANEPSVNASHLQVGTPIPEELLLKLTTRARNVLAREEIVSCEQLLSFQWDDLYELEGVGTTTVQDILRLQAKIVESHPEFICLLKLQGLQTVMHGSPAPTPF